VIPIKEQQAERHLALNAHSFALRRRSELPITETELKLMAAAAIMGLKSSPKNG